MLKSERDVEIMMNQEQIDLVLSGGDSSLFRANWRNIKTLQVVVGSTAVPFLLLWLWDYLNYPQVLWVLPFVLGYGLYLGLSNELVYYANYKDVWTVSGMFLVPLGIFLIGLTFIPEEEGLELEVVTWLMYSSMLGVFFWFGIKTANATAVLNPGVAYVKLLAVVMSKVGLIFVFGIVLAYSYRVATRDKSMYGLAKGALMAGAALAVAAWLYPRLVNLQAVEEKRQALN